MTGTPEKGPTRFRVADLGDNRPRSFELRPDKQKLQEYVQELGLLGLRKLSLIGDLAPAGRRDWLLKAKLGATVVQPCVVTLAPVTTRIDEPVERRFTPEMPELGDDEEIEMPEDDTLEPLSDVIDLEAILLESLSLALPPYPRADGAELGESVVTEPGKEALTDSDLKPFAGLAALRNKLADSDN